jgi:Uma2 family endonuclease
MRFMRIFTDINFSKEHENYRGQSRFASLVFRKIGCLRCPAITGLICRMSQPYEEILNGATLPRSAPADHHEQICARLHREMAVSIAGRTSTQLLAPRTRVQLSRTTAFCPDLALVMAATGKLFLAVEIISRDDHHADTVIKKELYEQHRVPRLWLVDPRYDNVEIYHSFDFGLKLNGILAGREVLAEKLIPQFQMTVAELFAV